MTCDVEDYFQVSAFEGVVPRERWTAVECRIARNLDRILQLFDEHDVKATFFTLGWMAANYPGAVRRIVEAGHEVASHGMQHCRVWTQHAEEFRDDAERSRKLLEDVCGVPVLGYRAASWSIDRRTPWAHKVLEEVGYKYSSSVYPVSSDHYGMPDAPWKPFVAAGTNIMEIPPTTLRFLGRNVPVAGGGYFRLYPLALSTYFLRRHLRSTPVPYLFYFHPWELDPDQPRLNGISMKSRFRHFLNLKSFEKRLRVLLQNFRWGRMDEVYFSEGAG